MYNVGPALDQFCGICRYSSVSSRRAECAPPHRRRQSVITMIRWVAQLVRIEVRAGCWLPSAVISVAICSEAISLSKARLLDVQHLAAPAAKWPGTCGSRPCLAEPPGRIAPRRCTARTLAGSHASWQSARPCRAARRRPATPFAPRHLARTPGRFRGAAAAASTNLAADDLRIGRPLQQETTPAARPQHLLDRGP